MKRKLYMHLCDDTNMEVSLKMDEERKAKIREFLNKPIFNIVAVNDRSLNLYDQALTHSTYAKEMKDRGIECDDNERLEFLATPKTSFTRIPLSKIGKQQRI